MTSYNLLFLLFNKVWIFKFYFLELNTENQIYYYEYSGGHTIQLEFQTSMGCTCKIQKLLWGGWCFAP
jgi:hypothetical protein